MRSPRERARSAAAPRVGGEKKGSSPQVITSRLQKLAVERYWVAMAAERPTMAAERPATAAERPAAAAERPATAAERPTAESHLSPVRAISQF